MPNIVRYQFNEYAFLYFSCRKENYLYKIFDITKNSFSIPLDMSRQTLKLDVYQLLKFYQVLSILNI